MKPSPAFLTAALSVALSVFCPNAAMAQNAVSSQRSLLTAKTVKYLLTVEEPDPNTGKLSVFTATRVLIAGKKFRVEQADVHAKVVANGSSRHVIMYNGSTLFNMIGAGTGNMYDIRKSATCAITDDLVSTSMVNRLDLVQNPDDSLSTQQEACRRKF